ncbi:MAG: ABC transporter substrate-binding protein [Waddliaceae bacterium]|nr:ABC transporter substrate-binding protein [Waddliaceae bacterium]
MKKIVTLLISALLCVACSKEEQNSKELKLALLHTADTLPVIVAKNNLFFEEEGIDVTLIKFVSAAERDSAFQAGQVDAMSADLVGTTLMRGAGMDVKIPILTMGHKPGIGRVAILKSPHSSISQAKDLEGKEIGLSLNTVIEYIADQLLATEGIDYNEVKKTSVPSIPTRLNMLIENQIDAVVLPDPLAAYAEEKGAQVLLDDKQDNLGQAVLTFHGKYLDSHEETVKAFIRAYNKAVRELLSHPEDYQELLTETIRLPKGMNYEVVEFPENQVPLEKHYLRVKQWLESKGTLKVDIPYDTLVSDAYLE